MTDDEERRMKEIDEMRQRQRSFRLTSIEDAFDDEDHDDHHHDDEDDEVDYLSYLNNRRKPKKE